MIFEKALRMDLRTDGRTDPLKDAASKTRPDTRPMDATHNDRTPNNFYT